MVPNLRTLAPQLLIAGVFPVIGYALLRPHVSSDATALAVGLILLTTGGLVELKRPSGLRRL